MYTFVATLLVPWVLGQGEWTREWWLSAVAAAAAAGLAMVGRKLLPLSTDRLGKGRQDLAPDAMVAHLKQEQERDRLRRNLQDRLTVESPDPEEQGGIPPG